MLYWLSGILALRIFVSCFCAGVFYMLTRTIFRMSVDAAEEQAYRRVKKGMCNPRRLRDARLRLSFLGLSVLLAAPLAMAYTLPGRRFMLWTEALTVLMAAVLYLLACDPLPPCEGTAWEWVRGLATGRAEPETD